MKIDSKFDKFVSWGFQAMLMAVMAWGTSQLSGLNRSVQELNVSVAVILEKDAARQRNLEKLESRVDVLEFKKRRKE